MLDQQVVQLAVEADATHIPNGIEVNVEGLEVGRAVHAGDLELPEGTSLAVDPDRFLHVMAAPTAEQIEAEIGGPGAETAAAVVGRARRRRRRELTGFLRRATGRRRSGRDRRRPVDDRRARQPGSGYAGNRHNAGHGGGPDGRAAGRSVQGGPVPQRVADGRLDGTPVTLAKPRTYMNASGRPVAGLPAATRWSRSRWWSSTTSWISRSAHQAQAGRRRQRPQRAALHHLGPGHQRLLPGAVRHRRPPRRMDAAAFVLRDFCAAERKELPLLIDRCADAVETLLSKGIAVAQNTFHAD